MFDAEIYPVGEYFAVANDQFGVKVMDIKKVN
jgi:hypothetical protein